MINVCDSRAIARMNNKCTCWCINATMLIEMRWSFSSRSAPLIDYSFMFVSLFNSGASRYRADISPVVFKRQYVFSIQKSVLIYTPWQTKSKYPFSREWKKAILRKEIVFRFYILFFLIIFFIFYLWQYNYIYYIKITHVEFIISKSFVISKYVNKFDTYRCNCQYLSHIYRIARSARNTTRRSSGMQPDTDLWMWTLPPVHDISRANHRNGPLLTSSYAIAFQYFCMTYIREGFPIIFKYCI